MSDNSLIAAASEVRSRAYAPYSNFAVGAALQTKSGKVFTGCNVENISLGLTICAERAALASAVADGEREFVAVAIVTGFGEPVFPCGACRQVLVEFNPELQIIAATTDGRSETVLLSDLLPRSVQKILKPVTNV
ncbi:MAG: cytidine deaminase [Verrucomicrobiota bacterium]